MGNRITRLLFDTAVLLYVDRFCPTERPTKTEMAMFDQFVVFAFIWAYSLRAQYQNLGWLSAQNYIMGSDITNSFNIYKSITESDSPVSLLSELSDEVHPLQLGKILATKDKLHDKDKDGIYQNYLYFFETNNYIIG